MNYKKHFEELYRNNMHGVPLFAKFCSSSDEDLPQKQSLKDKLRNLLSYLTRYRIIDTWTMHDDCM